MGLIAEPICGFQPLAIFYWKVSPSLINERAY
jgi:hypothetical protein